MPYIPYDLYESAQEIVIIMPLGGVAKKSVSLSIEDYRLVVRGSRKDRHIKETCLPLKQECYRWDIEQKIELPAQIYFDKIHSVLSADNVLEIVIPKAMIPEKIAIEVEYDV